MKYFRRYSSDGSCHIICLRCFATIGDADQLSAAVELERHHVCGQPSAQPGHLPSDWNSGQSLARFAGFIDFVRRLEGRYTPILFSIIIALLYGLPTALEILGVHYACPALALILFGDVTGCICLALVFGMPVIAAVLYLVWSLIEAWLYKAGTIHFATLPWILDLAPVLVIMGRITWLRSTMHKPDCPA